MGEIATINNGGKLWDAPALPVNFNSIPNAARFSCDSLGDNHTRIAGRLSKEVHKLLLSDGRPVIVCVCFFLPRLSSPIRQDVNGEFKSYKLNSVFVKQLQKRSILIGL